MFIKYLLSVHHFAVIVKEMSCAHGQMKKHLSLSLLHPKLTTSLILIWLFNDLKQVSVDVIMILDDVTISYMYMKNCK